MKDKKYKGMIFDLDGTLIDSKKDIAVATNATIKHMGGHELDHETIESFVGHGVRDLIRQSLKDVQGANEEEALRFFSEYYLQHCLDHTTFFDGVLETLLYMRERKIEMAILTNKPKTYTDVILKGLNITDWFCFVQGAETGLPHKPHATTTQAVLNKMTVKSNDILVVGDTDVDHEAAARLSLDSALVLYGFTPREEILTFKNKATYLLEEFSELKRLV